jgi:hypothetical protein
MKNALLFALVLSSTFVCAQGIKGCTSDVRTGVCNEVCSLKSVNGCTMEQFKPLFLIQNLDCETAAMGKGESAHAACKTHSDHLLQEWKDSHKKSGSSK